MYVSYLEERYRGIEFWQIVSEILDTTDVNQWYHIRIYPSAEIKQDGLIVLRSRAVYGLRMHYDVDEFPILAYHVTHLGLKRIHDEDHGGITKVLAKSGRNYWIVRARKLATKIIRPTNVV